MIDRVPQLGARAAYAKQAIRDKLIEHKQYIARHGEDMPEIAGWTWGREAASGGRPLDGGRQRLRGGNAAVNLFATRYGKTEWSLSGRHTDRTDTLDEKRPAPRRAAWASAADGSTATIGTRLDAWQPTGHEICRRPKRG